MEKNIFLVFLQTEPLLKYISKTAGVFFKPRIYTSLNSLLKPYPFMGPN